jgi:hypothetical protein
MSTAWSALKVGGCGGTKFFRSFHHTVGFPVPKRLPVQDQSCFSVTGDALLNPTIYPDHIGEVCANWRLPFNIAQQMKCSQGLHFAVRSVTSWRSREPTASARHGPVV